MNDPDLEQILRRYQPIDPPDDLLDRIISEPPSGLPRLAVATVAVCTTVALLAAQTANDFIAAERVPLESSAAIAIVRDSLGGGGMAEAVAVMLSSDAASQHVPDERMVPADLTLGGPRR